VRLDGVASFFRGGRCNINITTKYSRGASAPLHFKEITMSQDFAPTEEERIDELFRELEIEDAMLAEEELDVDVITDFIEAGFDGFGW